MRRIPGYPLFLGNVGDIRNASLIIANVGAVIDLAGNEAPATLARDLVYCRFPIVDGAGNPPWLLRGAAEAVAALIRAGVPTLVYCGAGMSRTPAIAAAGLALATGLTPGEALTQVCGDGPADVSPALWADVRSVVGGAST
jgi:protein-tyrosine phosphatase